MASIEVVAPQRLAESERTAVARLYVDAFRRKLRAPLGGDPVDFVASVPDPDMVLMAKDADEVLGMAGLRYDGRGFFHPTPEDFRAHYGRVGGVRAAAWRWTVTWPRDHQLLLEALAVRSDARGTGVGSALLTAVDRRARASGKTAVILEVVDTNPRAAALYRRHGYRTVHTVRRVAFRVAGFRSAELMLKEL
jgi:ribosomal protein S18 acetylase RimI-like enzyme